MIHGLSDVPMRTVHISYNLNDIDLSTPSRLEQLSHWLYEHLSPKHDIRNCKNPPLILSVLRFLGIRSSGKVIEYQLVKKMAKDIRELEDESIIEEVTKNSLKE